MRPQFNQEIRKSIGLLALLLMMALVIFSACNFRKSLQAHYSIPFVKSLNIVKATVSTLNICASGEQAHLQKCNAKKHQADLDLQLFPAVPLVGLAETVTADISLRSGQLIARRIVPFYILYHNIKIFS